MAIITKNLRHDFYTPLFGRNGILITTIVSIISSRETSKATKTLTRANITKCEANLFLIARCIAHSQPRKV